MSRNKGTFNFSANFETRARSPLDAKQLVASLADLVSTTQWQSNPPSSDEWTYIGMMVSVYADPTPSNNGVYRLTATDYTNIANWQKVGGSEPIGNWSFSIDGAGDLLLSYSGNVRFKFTKDGSLAAEDAMVSNQPL